ncbi:zinc finger protein 675-like [Anoplophora glabripennis]|uniref:zinc finger protein 675-like n=1 Tax=Anoplophora glabripennis TaxID=217634 RepID=UPI0008759F14|nr:zinc finger protein 675-like [Anoplophora glabripennis]
MQWTQNLCRCCGQISETCHSIFNSEIPSALEDKIKKCLNLNLCKDDYKPKQICNGCVVKLNEFSEFMDTCYATNQKFESIYFNSPTWQSRSYDYPPLQKQSVIVSNKQVPDNLDIELYKNTGMVLDNLNISNCQLNETDVLELVGDGNYNTENCTQYMNDSKIRSPYITVLRHPSTTEEHNASSSYSCQDTGNNRMCYLNNSYNTNGSSAELRDLEEDAESLRKKTVTVDAVQNTLKRPASTYHKEKLKKLHPCPHCLRTFSRRGTLNSHVANHTNVRPYRCEDCSKSFAVKSELTTHRKVHGDKHKCVYCAKKFSVPSKLLRHIRIHTNDKPFVCNVANCGKRFSDKRNLEGHKLLHTSEKNYPCSVCAKSFKTANRLKQHSKCHTCGVMYTCDLCSKKFKYKSNLISHIKKHNNICPYCKINCESKTLLTYHLKTCKARL